MKKQILKENIVGILITLVFILGFLALVQLDSSITGAGEFNFIVPELSISEQVNSLDVDSEVLVGGLSIRKIEDDPAFEVEFSKILKEKEWFVLEFGINDYNGSLDVWVEFLDVKNVIEMPLLLDENGS